MSIHIFKIEHCNVVLNICCFDERVTGTTNAYDLFSVFMTEENTKFHLKLVKIKMYFLHPCYNPLENHYFIYKGT